MLNASQGRWRPVWGEMDVHLAVAGDICDGVFLYCAFSHEVT